MINFKELGSDPGYAGAEGFDNGQDALISYEVLVHDDGVECEGVIILDKNAIFIQWFIPELDDLESSDYEDKWINIEPDRAYEFICTRLIPASHHLELDAEELAEWSNGAGTI
jgi:hypothetical protein